MLLAVDIGNSSIKLGVFDINNKSDINLLCNFKISSVTERSADEYEIIIRSLISSKCSELKISRSVICSVVPSLTHVIYDALYSITGYAPFVVGSGTKTGFKIKTDSPAEFGADMVCNAAAVLDAYTAPSVIIDMGTATTITYINGNKEIEGSVIIPGVAVSLNALTDSAELLSKFSIKKPNQLIGKNTADSIMSGVVYGNLFTINSFLNGIIQNFACNGTDPIIIATGGISSFIIPYCDRHIEIIENLTLRGAVSLYVKNRGQK